MSSDLLIRSALWYGRHGWRVFPCRPKGKLPIIKAWQRDATTDPRMIEAWWRRTPDANVGIACGPATGIYVVDVDQHGDDGEVTLLAVQRQLGQLPPTVEQRTGSGGRQLVFAYPADRVCRNTNGAKRGLGRGVDTRGAGGFVVVPPSIHPCGESYFWKFDPHRHVLAALPEKWIARLERRPEVRITVPIRPLRVMQGYDRAHFERRLRELATTGPGGRNDALYRNAFWARSRAREGSLSWSEARELLEDAARQCGLDPREITATLNSAARGTECA